MLRAKAQFSDPGEQSVTITLTGNLSEFEQLRTDLHGSEIPFYRVQALVDMINRVSLDLRATVHAGPEDAREG